MRGTHVLDSAKEHCVGIPEQEVGREVQYSKGSVGKFLCKPECYMDA